MRDEAFAGQFDLEMHMLAFFEPVGLDGRGLEIDIEAAGTRYEAAAAVFQDTLDDSV